MQPTFGLKKKVKTRQIVLNFYTNSSFRQYEYILNERRIIENS